MNLSKQRGVSLVELMVAITIGLILLAGVFSIFFSSKVTYFANEKTARLQESGRVAIDLLAHDVRSAGYMGCARGSFNSLLNSSTTLLWNYSLPLQGFESDGVSAWSPAITAGTLVPAPIAAGDIVVVRTVRRDALALRLEADLAGLSSNPTTVHDPSIQAGQIMLITDCMVSTVFQVTGNTAGVITHATGGTSPGNSTTDLGKIFAEGARLAPLETVTYYLANEPVTNEPSLYRQTGNTQPADLLIEGVEGMQIAYGVDTGTDRIADEYRSAATVANWDRVLSVSISLLVRSAEEGNNIDTNTYQLLPTALGGKLVNPVDDRRMRMVFPTTIALRNRAL